MSRVARILYDPQDAKSVAEHATRVQRVVDGMLEFGSPQDPSNPASATRANGIAHNGILQNMDGAWFTAELTAAGRTDRVCIHNLYDSTFTPTSGLVPVRWIVMGWGHDGTGGGAATELDLSVFVLGTVASIAFDRITLTFVVNQRVGPAITINADHPVRVDLFFIRAVR